ncbi:Virulence-associated E [uncultured Caudovirales phage]|uniref:Virulence-associated E n=1 Tax=uncultured Caudovirales phage TaxID=2100421 RepID=A0A6J5KG32_9CAUD|nr:Virulence-associated E [uncultured Caudovirales phage]
MEFDAYKGLKPAMVIKSVLDIIHAPGEVFEIRIPKTKAGTISGYFDDTTKAAAIIARENGKHQAIYATINPIKKELLARNENKLEHGSQTTTTDAEIERRRWFLLDFDPVRAVGISSTNEEMEYAERMANDTVDWLTSLGWPVPIIAYSGNGMHAMYQVDEPNDDTTRIDFEFATKMIASIFSTDKVNVDSGVYNASRIWKVYGTLSAKGSNTESRPHRVALIKSIPSETVLVTREQIENVARPLRDAKSEEFKDMTGEYIADMVKWLSDRGLTVTSGPRPMFGNEGRKWTISRCPFNHDHTDPMVGLVNNRPVFRCLHNSCSAFKWKEFREKVDPTYKDPDTVFTRLKEWCDGEESELNSELAQSACATQKALAGILKKIKKEVQRERFLLLEDHIKAEKRRYIRDVLGDNNEKGNLVGLINRTRTYQQEGIVPMYWMADFDFRIRVGPVGDIDCPMYSEEDEISLMIRFHSVGDSWVKQTHAGQIIKHLAGEYKVNPLKVYLKNKRWDGTKRLDSWLADFMGTKDTEYTRAVGRKWLISAVARAMDPGCQADHMLIFEGAQGIGKSQVLRALGGQFYVEYSAGITSGPNGHKDMVAVIIGKMIIEMSELATLRRADMESLKATLTTTTDEARLSYERYARPYPRTCVFAGTTNDTGKAYIADQSGARRFWPVYCGEIKPVNAAALRVCVDQLWAEAVEAYDSGEDWYSVPAELVSEEQSARQILLEDSDPWYSRIRNALTEPDNFVEVFYAVPEFISGQETGGFCLRVGQMHHVLGSLLGIDASRQSPNDVIRLQGVLRAIGFKKTRPSQKWFGNSYTYQLTRDAMPHMWGSIDAARKSCRFPSPFIKQTEEKQ